MDMRGRDALRLAALLLALAALMDASPSKSLAGRVVVRAGGAKAGARAGAKAGAETLWWHNAVVYQVYPRSFMDTNNDGLGDVKGITSKLDYLKDIGVTAVWLSPFYPSPQKDFGYDISDFKNVDPSYGTLADFDAMVKRAHDLDMKVVVDLVPNHSSDQHQWFQKSVNREGQYTDYYVWADAIGRNSSGSPIPPNNWVSHFRFSAWEWNEKRQQFYLHQFVKEQPDLNYRSADVVQEMKDVFTFWMDHGVDGFRVDALPFLFETEDLSQDEPPKDNPDTDLNEDDYDFYTHPWTMDHPKTYDMLTQWRALVDGYKDGKARVIMTECYTSFDKTIEYYGTKEKPGAHFTFNFQLISNINKSSKAADFKTIIDQWMAAMGDWRWPNWVIGNHDNSRVATRYPHMADAMNMISLTLPGTAMTYYGEELGMTDAFITWEQTKDPSGLNAGEDKYQKFTRDPERTPMQWDDSTSAGFSTNAVTWMPTNPNYWKLNVKKQKADDRSHLNVYKALTTARNTETMKRGSLTTAVLQDDVLALTRALDGHDTFITVVNLGSWEKSIRAKDLLSTGDLKVYTASDNSQLSRGMSFVSATLRPKTSIILTTGTVPSSSSSSSRTAAASAALLSLALVIFCRKL